MRHSHALIPIDRVRAFHLSGILCALFLLGAVYAACDGRLSVAAHAMALVVLYAVAVRYRFGWIPPFVLLGVNFGPLILERLFIFLDDRVPLMIYGGILGIVAGAILDWRESCRVCRVREANHDGATEEVRLEDSANPTDEKQS
jgi:hypothetical protein